MGCGKSKQAKKDIAREVEEKAPAQENVGGKAASELHDAATEVLQAVPPISPDLEAKTETVEMTEIALENKPMVQEAGIKAAEEVQETVEKENMVGNEETVKPSGEEETVEESKDDFPAEASPGKLKSASVTEIINQWNKSESPAGNRQNRSASTPQSTATRQELNIHRGSSVKDKIAFFASANPQNSSSEGINKSLRNERHASVQDETSGRLDAGRMAKYWEAVKEVNETVVTTKTF